MKFIGCNVLDIRRTKVGYIWRLSKNVTGYLYSRVNNFEDNKVSIKFKFFKKAINTKYPNVMASGLEFNNVSILLEYAIHCL